MLEEMLQRAGPEYKKCFQEKQMAAQHVPRRASVSAITRNAMWLNHLKYFRISLAISTSIACLYNGKAVACMAGDSGKSFLECLVG